MRKLLLLVTLLLSAFVAACGSPPQAGGGEAGGQAAATTEGPANTPTPVVLATPTPKPAPPTPTPRATPTVAPIESATEEAAAEATTEGTTETESEATTEAAATEEPAAAPIPEDMVLIDAGPFTMGQDGGKPKNGPAHEVDLPAYEIDRFEVTNDEFARFVEEAGYQTYAEQNSSKNWKDVAEGKGNHPVVYITWDDAKAYCEWAGKRLPSEAEWEKALAATMVGFIPGVTTLCRKT
ncbi:MAG: formylglycine-generating enzyme family protein, partial [Anaerolineales bacterium]|nr:formylglycine-generating enzyme family protein [Anaerolineales bacterium]